MKNNTGKKIIALILFFIAATFFLFFKSDVQSNLTFNVKTNKSQVINTAKELGNKYDWAVKNSMQVADFSLDEKSQTYYELQVGNYKKLNSLIEKEKGYIPAIWTVSIIPQSGKDKVDVYFTPSGKAYGFYRMIPEDYKGPALSEEAAKVVAEKEATSNWNFDLNEYKLIDKSKKNQANGRIDYTLNYEKNTKIGEAEDKVELVVSGDKLTKVQHYLDVPESFTRKYEERRSSNDTIANGSFFTFYILISIIGLFCFSYLNKRKMIIWKKPLILSIVIAGLTVLSGMSGLKQGLTNVNTSYFTPGIFYIVMIFALLLGGILTGLVTFASIFIGEGLSRKAFPKHLQFWKMISIKNFGSWKFLNRVIIGYIFAVSMLIYETLFYGTMNHFPGWWQPASMVTDPNIANDWFAWLKGFAQALNAGFFEEFAFRAIPISLGVLVGTKYNKRKLGIIIAFIFEVLMFSAGHANYPGFPAYARLVELLVVAFGFGLLFYYFGIIPGIIAHFSYDFILMTMMVMTTSSVALIYQKILVVLIIIFPLALAVYGRVKNRSWIDVEEDAYNVANQGELIEESSKNRYETVVESDNLNKENETLEVEIGKNSKRKNIIISIVTALIGIIAIVGLFTIHSAVPPLHTEKIEAESLARQEIEKQGFKLSNEWKVISSVEESTLIDNMDQSFLPSTNDFIKNEGKDKYKELIGNYINPLKWNVRFVKTTGDVNERAEEFDVAVIDKAHEINVKHVLPKNRKGDNLTKEKAEAVLYDAIKNKYNLKKSDLKEVSASEIKLENRTDWSFTLEDKTTTLKLYRPEIKAVVSGDKVLTLNKTLELPENKKSELFKKTIIIVIVAVLVLLPFIISIIISAIKSIGAWSKKRISKPIFIRLYLILLVLNISSLMLNIPIASMGFSTEKPFNVQLVTSLAFGVLGKVIISFLGACIISYAKSFYKEKTKCSYNNIVLAILGGLLIFSIGVIFTARPILKVDNSIYSSLGSYNKFLSQICDMCTSYIGGLAITAAIIATIKNIKNKYIKVILTVLLFLSICLLSSLSNIYSPVDFAVPLLKCAIYILLYKYLYKNDIVLITLTVGIMNIMDSVKEIILNQYPTLRFSMAVSIVVVIYLTIYTYRLLRRNFVEVGITRDLNL